MSTYILCGFTNFASIGIQIGGIGALVPDRKGLLSELGIFALIAGTRLYLLRLCRNDAINNIFISLYFNYFL